MDQINAVGVRKRAEEAASRGRAAAVSEVRRLSGVIPVDVAAGQHVPVLLRLVAHKAEDHKAEDRRIWLAHGVYDNVECSGRNTGNTAWRRGVRR